MVIIGCPTGGAACITWGGELILLEDKVSDGCSVWEGIWEEDRDGEGVYTSLGAGDEVSEESLTDWGCRGNCIVKWVKEVKLGETVFDEMQDWETEEKSEPNTNGKEFS